MFKNSFSVDSVVSASYSITCSPLIKYIDGYNKELLAAYLKSLMLQYLNPKEYQVLRLSYGLDCDKRSAKEIADILGIKGSSSYVRISQLKKVAIDKLIDNVSYSQVIDYL